MPVSNQSIDFSDFSGGKNSAFPAHALAENQVVDTLNLIHEMIGISRAPGYCGITEITPIDGITVTIEDGIYVFETAADNPVIVF